MTPTGSPVTGSGVISLDQIREAAGRLEGIAHRTPVFASRALDERTRGRIWLKAESFQRTGSFKFRGAYNRIASLAPDVQGVATHSSGNHAQAVALAANLRGLPAVVVMPEDAPVEKLEATRGYGAEVVPYDRYTQDREALAREVAEQRGLVLVPPYEDPMVMAGQGTAALELAESVGALDVLVVPVSGGGLIAGCATAVKALSPATRVVGVEPEAGDDTRRSLQAGERVRIEVPRTIADGLQVEVPGELTFEVNRRLVDEIATVTDREIVEAMAFLFERLKIVVEPSGAAGLAAVLAGKVPVRSLRVGVILSGGNVSPERFVQLIGSL